MECAQESSTRKFPPFASTAVTEIVAPLGKQDCEVQAKSLGTVSRMQ
jgi:hypothetical protein